MSSRLSSLLILLCCVYFSSAAIAAPSVKTPFSSTKVTLDGRVTDLEWRDAAIIYANRDWCNPDPSISISDLQRIKQITTVFVKYDNSVLLVGVKCVETEPGYPKAHKRATTDRLENDDAVQVVLGVADENVIKREVLNMGGYPGAMNQAVSSADHYYQFTVNAAGSTSRTYNESILQRPLFSAAVSHQADGWSAEMRIPFSSVGITSPSGKTIFANVFRYRPPDMLGWYLPGFGGYVPMPFGEMTFLARGQESARTLESPPSDNCPKLVQSSLIVSGDIAWYPLARCVSSDISVSGDASGAIAALRIDGIGEKKIALGSASHERLIYDLPSDASLPAHAEVQVTGKDGSQLCHASRELQPVGKPEWYDSKVGLEYIADRIPSPWSIPVVKDCEIQLCDKTLGFAENGLFKSISDNLGEMLAGPGEILLNFGGRDITLRPGNVKVSAQGTSVLVEGNSSFDGGEVEIRSLVDYDGFTVVKLRVRGADPKRIERLSIRIPVMKNTAKFVHRTLVQEIYELTGYGWEGIAAPFWLGGYDKGLSFSYDLNPFLSKHRRSQIQVVEDGGKTWLTVNLVDGSGEVSDPDHIFRFFLQPTPTKPLSLRKESSILDFVWEQYSDYQGYPDTSKISELKKLADKSHANGRLFAVYTDQLLAENSPGFQTYREDLLDMPQTIMARRAYDPGKGIPCYLCCKRGPEGDLQLTGLQKLMDEAGIDGIYSDGMSVAWECDNPSHKNGCGRPVDISWDGREITRIVGQREFLKRLRGMFDKRGKPFYFGAHCGGGLDINTLSFFDGYLEGEQLWRYQAGFKLPLATVAVGYCGRPWGFRAKFWDNFFSRGGATNWALAYSLIHDTESDANTPEERAIFNGFEDDKLVKLYPYWRSQPHIKRLAGKSLCTYYLKSDAAMLILSNLAWTADRVSLDVSKLFPGSRLQATDPLTGDPVSIEGKKIDLSLLPYHFAAVRVEKASATNVKLMPPTISTQQTKPAAEFRISGTKPGQWSPGENAIDVTTDVNYDMGNGRKGIKLSSTESQSSATAELKSNKLGRNGTIRLMVRRSGPIRLEIGNSGICFDWQWRLITPDRWNDGQLFQNTVPTEKAEMLILSLKDGNLDVVYGGIPIARNVKLDLGAENSFRISTWAGGWIAFDVLEISNNPSVLFSPQVKHPIL